MTLLHAAVLIATLLYSRVSLAQGVSFLGMCNKSWNCEATAALWDKKIVTGWLENTFGEQCDCADKLLQDPRSKVVRVHIINSPCMRNNRCRRYEVLYGETAASASRKILRKDKRFFKKFDAVLERAALRIESAKGRLRCYISPCLECDLYENARRVLLLRVSARMPYCRVVDNPNSGSCIRGAVCERHGDSPSTIDPCIVDLDGTDGSRIDANKWVARYRHCAVSYYWEPWMNCITGRFVDPRKRVCDYGKKYFTRLKEALCHSSSHQSYAICSH